MKLEAIIELLSCQVHSCVGRLDNEVTCCMATDMMSDALTLGCPGFLLITSLCSAQAVRTAEVADASAILFLRGKKPDQASINLADQLSIPLLTTDHGMFDTCWILHEAGLGGAS